MKIEVLMSTYNGEKYLKEQIVSILNQKDVDIHLTIRDDGSNDKTVEVLKKIESNYPTKIKVFTGENLGYTDSFLELLSLAHPADYYAYSDQDDIWQDIKCISAINCMKDTYDLYVGSVENYDENINYISKNDMTTGFHTLESDFVRHRFPGCTMVFTNKVKDLSIRVAKCNSGVMISHDFVISAVSYCCGKVYVDSNSYIKHRRTFDSLTSRGKGILNRIKVEYNIMFVRHDECYELSKMLINAIKKELMMEEDYLFLNLVMNYRKTIASKIKLLLHKKFTSGYFVCDFETKLKILLNRF